jgi:nitrite reductase/ring-hydroxylating ferredoxin subunit
MGVSYIPVARIGELSAGAMKEVDLGGRQVLVAFVEGKYYAFSRHCPHEEADLKEAGQLLGNAQIRCNNHSYCFDLKTGDCTLPKGRTSRRRTGRRGLHSPRVVNSRLAIGSRCSSACERVFVGARIR